MSGLSLTKSIYTANFGTVLARVRERLASQKAVAGRPRAGQLSGVAAAASDHGQQQSKGFCYCWDGSHRVRECSKKRKVSANKVQKRAGCFRCGSAEHFVRNCSQSGATAAAELCF